jgi:long-chain acyl-CoA synthetase
MGVIYARGPQIMMGYYGDREATARVLSGDGWLDTGDLGVMSHDGAIAIVGRIKDIIVLLDGENFEPVPIEKHLGALIVPDFNRLKEYAAENGIACSDTKSLLSSPEVRKLYRRVIDDEINRWKGFKTFEHIYDFTLPSKVLEVPRELSAKQTLKRNEVYTLYEREIRSIFER